MEKKKGGKPFFGVDAAIVVKDKTKEGEGEGDKKRFAEREFQVNFILPAFLPAGRAHLPQAAPERLSVSVRWHAYGLRRNQFP